MTPKQRIMLYLDITQRAYNRASKKERKQDLKEIDKAWQRVLRVYEKRYFKPDTLPHTDIGSKTDNEAMNLYNNKLYI